MSRNDRAKEAFPPVLLTPAARIANCIMRASKGYLAPSVQSLENTQIAIKLQGVADLVSDPATRDIGGR